MLAVIIMTARQTIKATTTRTTRRATRGIPAIAASMPTPVAQSATSSQGKPKRGRPVGSKDTKPRKTRSDKGKPRGPYKKRAKK